MACCHARRGISGGGSPPDSYPAVGVGRPSKDTVKKGTAVKQNYQTIGAAATALAVPEPVSVAVGHLAADVREACWRWLSAPGCR
jgi:hypothetical protein